MPSRTKANKSKSAGAQIRPDMKWWLVALGVAATLVWYLNSPKPIDVADAEVGPQSGLLAIVNTCDGDLSFKVQEDDHVVVIEVFDNRFRVRFYANDCQDGLRVPLAVPLGTRMLVDGSTNEQVPVSVVGR